MDTRIEETGVLCACGRPACWGVMLGGKPACTECFDAAAAEAEASMMHEWEARKEAEEMFGSAIEIEFPDGEFPDARQWTDPMWGTY